MIQEGIARGLGGKAEMREIDSLGTELSKKVDYDHLKSLVSQTKSELFELF